MLYLKSNEEKKLVFEVDIHGCNTDELQGFVRFEIYGAEYGFPVEVDDRKITAIIPPLKTIVEKDIEDGTVVPARLDMITERHYFMPWEGEVKIGAPMDIKAKIKEEKGSSPAVSSKLLTSASVREEKSSAVKASKTKSEGLSEDDRIARLERVVSNLATTIAKDKGLIESRKVVRRPKKGVAKEEVITEQPKQRPINEAGWSKEKLKNITEAQIYQYMHRAGTKNQTIQEIVYNNAVAAAAEAGDTSNYGVLKQVIKMLKKGK